MDYTHIPAEISSSDLAARDGSWSPSMYREVRLPSQHRAAVSDLLDARNPFDRGIEPGSAAYMRASPTHLIRTKSLQADSYLIYPKGDSIVPINPRSFRDPQFRDGDILMSKDSNVGEVALVFKDDWPQHAFSGGILRLHPTINPYYLFAFLKHPIFKAQLTGLVPRGATIKHAKDLWLDCLVPVPSNDNADDVTSYVAALTLAAARREREIRKRNQQIDALIAEELARNQKPGQLRYELPDLQQVRALGRLDASMYGFAFKRAIYLIENYTHGTGTYKDLGFSIGRGQNLQVSCIGKSIYSDQRVPGFYRLAAPTDFSEYRTVRQYRYLGNRRKLSLLKKGDVVFGAEGFCKGRVIIVGDESEPTISNIHGVIFHPLDKDPVRGITLGCYLGYLRAQGIVDAVGAGGSGGSLAIGYFHHIPIPRFPYAFQEKLAALYSYDAARPKEQLTRDNFAAWHGQWDNRLGVWELNRELSVLREELAALQLKIIEGGPICLLQQKLEQRAAVST